MKTTTVVAALSAAQHSKTVKVSKATLQEWVKLIAAATNADKRKLTLAIINADLAMLLRQD